MKLSGILLFLCVLPSFTGVCAQSSDPAAQFSALVAADSADAQAWYQVAGDARAAGETDVALRALQKAEKLGFSPLPVGLERVRIAVVDKNPQMAISQLQAIAATGFAAVQVLTTDPLINSLAGDSSYDDLVASMSVQAYPCAHQEKFREFDFWLGDWEVRASNGQLAGHNRIRSEERGCVITEHWVGAQGGTGMSINYLDKVANQWVQVWTAEGGSQIVISGGMTDDGMSLKGTLHDVNSGSTLPFRGLWTLLQDGRVRQFFEQSNDDGATWVPWFEGFYTRADED